MRFGSDGADVRGCRVSLSGDQVLPVVPRVHTVHEETEHQQNIIITEK